MCQPRWCALRSEETKRFTGGRSVFRDVNGGGARTLLRLCASCVSRLITYSCRISHSSRFKLHFISARSCSRSPRDFQVLSAALCIIAVGSRINVFQISVDRWATDQRSACQKPFIISTRRSQMNQTLSQWMTTRDATDKPSPHNLGSQQCRPKRFKHDTWQLSGRRWCHPLQTLHSTTSTVNSPSTMCFSAWGSQLVQRLRWWLAPGGSSQWSCRLLATASMWQRLPVLAESRDRLEATRARSEASAARSAFQMSSTLPGRCSLNGFTETCGCGETSRWWWERPPRESKIRIDSDEYLRSSNWHKGREIYLS